jgi:hypothetical protein
VGGPGDVTAHLFLGGPRDGRWADVGDRHNYLVPIAPKFFEFTRESEILAEPSRASVATYRRHEGNLPGWRIPLTFWVVAGFDPLGTPGTVLPGYVVGVRLESSILCADCRAHRGSPSDGLCVVCCLARNCAHVWIDGVGNELDRCARCGVPE